jgi:hypothetical protein
VAINSLGNDVYVNTSIFHTHLYFDGSCSESKSPKIMIVTTDESSLIETCVEVSDGYLTTSSSNPPGRN